MISAVAPGFSVLMLGRVITSLCQGAFFGFGAVVATKVVPKNKQASAVATMFMGLSIANIGGVPGIAWLGQQVGWRIAFFGIAILGVLALLGIALALPRGEAGSRPNARHELRALCNIEMAVAMGTTILFASAFFSLYTYIAPVLQRVNGASNGFVTLALVLIGIGLTLGNWLGGKLADRSLDMATAVGMGSLALSMLIMPLLLGHNLPTVIILPLWAVTAFLVVPPLQMRAMRAAEKAPSLAAAINIAGFNLGNAVGASAGGAVIGLGLGYAAVPLAGGVLAFFGLCLVIYAHYKFA